MSLQYRIAFSLIPGINLGMAQQLLCAVGSEEEFFAMSDASLRSLLPPRSKVVEHAFRDSLLEKARTEMEYMDRSGIHQTYFTDSDFPPRLLQCSDGPVMLYTYGSCALHAARPVAVVGTRHATVYGTDFTRRMVQHLAETVEGVVIVSGLAYGIDVAAHKAALEYGVPTVAVMAHPLNTVYPADHRDVARRIVQQGGAMVSEYASCRFVHKGNFLERNRIVAGLCDATVIVESDKRGGAMATARIASAYDREVLAVPGRIGDRFSAGCNHLIAHHVARLIDSPQALPDALGWPQRQPEGSQPELPLALSPEEEALLALITEHPELTVNDLAARLNISYASLTNLIFGLEMQELITAIPGSRYAALPR